MRRVIRRTAEANDNDEGTPVLPAFDRGHQPINPLPSVNGTSGADVSHTLRAKRVHTIATMQWACGMPIAWAKCYRSESLSQIFAFIDWIWVDRPEDRPNYTAFDNACGLLRHIITSHSDSSWLQNTRFVCDVFHYRGHQAMDVLCRLWCNPSPADGSQPDLVVSQTDEDGRVHQGRSFNTETAEQFNNWLNGFQNLLRKMTAGNFDIFMHTLLLIYAEAVEETIQEKGYELTEEFWDRAAEELVGDE